MVKTLVKKPSTGWLATCARRMVTISRQWCSTVLAAAGDQVELRSDYNLLIALNRITPEDLRAWPKRPCEWQRLGNPLPVYFTVEELSDAADVFPIEFHQMANARIILFGSDPFEFVKLSDTHLRHQAEYELRSKLIQLRRLYIPAWSQLKNLVI